MSDQHKQEGAVGGAHNAKAQIGAEEVVDVRENDVEDDDEDLVLDERDFMDPYEQQMEDLYHKNRWPINDEEPGFALVVDNMQRLERLAADQLININLNVVPGNALFPHRRHFAKDAPADPKQIKQMFNKWPEKLQNKYLEELRAEFPELEVMDVVDNQIPPELLNEDLFKGMGRGFMGMRKRQQMELERIMAEERLEYAGKIALQQKLTKNARKHDKNQLIDTTKRALKNNTEDIELQHLKYLMGDRKKGKPRIVEKPVSMLAVLLSHGTAHLEDMNHKILAQLFSQFTFQGLLVLSKLSSKWNTMFHSVFECQTFLWFCNEEKNERRFLPIEDCCEECHEFLGSEPVIRVVENKLIAVIDDVLSMTKNLKCLRLYRFQFDKLLIVKKLSDNCPQIQHLDLTECFDFALVVIKELCFCYPNLKHLILTATNLNEEMLSHIIKNMSKLVTLGISSTLISGQSLQSLPNSLTRLDIRCCPKLKPKELIKFLKYSGYIHLEHLKIDSFKDKEIYRLIWSFFKSSLILLEVRDAPRDPLSGQSYVSEIPSMLFLQSLNLGKNIVFEARVFDNIINSCPNMRSFSMQFDAYDAYRMSEQNLLQIAHKWPHLERLQLIGCRFLGELFVRSLQALFHLQYLNLTECSQLKDHFMIEVLPKMPKLNFVVLDKCLNVGKRTLESLIVTAKKRSPQLFSISMIRCNLRTIPYLKAKYLPPNVRITYSSRLCRRYVTFDGQRTKIGNISHICEFLNGK